MAKQGTTPNQQNNLYWGKFASEQEAYKGYQNLVEETTKRGTQNQMLEAQLQAARTDAQKMQDLLAQTITSGSNRAPVPEVDIVDADGEVTPETLKAYIASRLNPVSDAVRNLPQTVESATKNALEQLLAPAQAANIAGMQYFNSPRAKEDRFDNNKLNELLSNNPEINNTFQALIGSPATAVQAYDYAHRVWKSEGGSAVDKYAKADASGLPETSGNPMALPGEHATQEDLMRLAQKAAGSYQASDKTDFATKIWKGTKLEQQLDQMKAYGESMGIDME